MNLSSLILKYFFPYADKKEFNKWATFTLGAAVDFLENKDGEKLHEYISPSDIAKLFQDFLIPEKGKDLFDVLSETMNHIVKNSVKVSHPFYIGHMTSACPNFTILCDLIISFLNQNLVKIETALSATYVERQILNWMHNLIYNNKKLLNKKIFEDPNYFLGNFCSGGTIGNITALLVARNKLFPNVHKDGINTTFKKIGCKKAVVLVSSRGHYSIKKAAAILGIGEKNVIPIPCHRDNNNIDIKKLDDRIKKLIKQQIKIIAIVGIAGTTETGNIDNLNQLATVAKKYKIWFHVDAAWGGALLFSKKYKSQLLGIEKADSVVIDGHKFLFLTVSNSAVLFKATHDLNLIKHNANYIIRDGSSDLGKTSIEGSRRFDSLKLWFAIKIIGREGYEALINNGIENAFLFKQLIDSHPSFEMTNIPETGIITYRFIPKILKVKLQTAKNIYHLNKSQQNVELKRNFTKLQKDFLSLILQINAFINELNINLQKQQRKNGKSFVSRTLLESVWERQEIVVLRAIPFNPLIKSETLSEILTEQEAIGNALFESAFPDFLKQVPLAVSFVCKV
jgi:glutamate decarboxylase